MIAAVVGGEPDISGGVLNGLKHELSRKLTRLAKLRRLFMRRVFESKYSANPLPLQKKQHPPEKSGIT